MLGARLYSVSFENVAVTASQDLFYIAPADDKPCVVHAVYLGQTTEIGDAMEEQVRIKMIRGHATVGSGGSAPTPRPLSPSDGAAGFVARVNDTTIASAGTAVDLHADTWQLRGPYQVIFTPEMRHQVTQAAGVTWVVRLMAAPTDSVTMSGTIYVAELG
jgi:hypothetical protein